MSVVEWTCVFCTLTFSLSLFSKSGLFSGERGTDSEWFRSGARNTSIAHAIIPSRFIKIFHTDYVCRFAIWLLAIFISCFYFFVTSNIFWELLYFRDINGSYPWNHPLCRSAGSRRHIQVKSHHLKFCNFLGQILQVFENFCIFTQNKPIKIQLFSTEKTKALPK